MRNTQRLTRRSFLKLGGAGLLLPLAGCASLRQGDAKAKPYSMGIIADLHHGLEPTAMERLAAFIDAAGRRGVDAILQLGDFNYGKPESRECMDLWNRFEGEKFHVLGNHDMDFFNKEHMVEFWSMPGRYYSFDRGGYHFVVLDRNNLNTPEGFVPYEAGNFYMDGRMRGWADPGQLEWLTRDLEAARYPSVVFMHQCMGLEEGPYPEGDPRAPIEAVFEEVRLRSGRGKVAACFCGHAHLDRYNERNGIHYVWINSISYNWVGPKYGRMAPYRDPLFAFVIFHPEGLVEIEGRRTEWVPPSPKERGHPEADKLTPSISDRRLEIDAPLTTGWSPTRPARGSCPGRPSPART